ncbi:hypothetical protein JST97_07205 [bacterium]|nr:hypothetical protein [bacterium]
MSGKAFLKLIGLTLLVAAYPKIRHPVSFRVALESYQLFPAFSLGALQVFVPLGEVILGLKLLFRPTGKSIWFASALFAGFALVLSAAWMRGEHLVCGCFGRVDMFLHMLPHGLSIHILLNLAASAGLFRCRNLVGGADRSPRG